MKLFRKALKAIAKEEGISTKEVYRQMREAINIGMSNPDPAIRRVWQNIILLQGEATPENVLAYCAAQIEAEHK